MQNCDYIEKYVIDYIYDELSAKAKTLVEAHLQDCPQCNIELQEMQATLRLMKTIDEEEPARLLYFKEKKSLLSKIFDQKSVLAFAASILIFMNAIILVKFYTASPVTNVPPAENITNNQQIDTKNLIQETLGNYQKEQNLLMESKFQALENKLMDHQSQQLVLFRDAIDRKTQEMVSATLKVHDDNRVNDLQNVAKTILTMQERNELERAQT